MHQLILKEEPIKGKRFQFTVTRVTKANANGFLVRPHWHEQLEFIKVKRGKVVVTIDENKFKAEEGDLIFINSGQIHIMEPIGDDASIEGMIFGKHLISDLSESYDTRHLYYLHISGKIHRNLFSLSHDLWRELNECMEASSNEYYAQDICHEMIIKSCIYRMITAILRYYREQNNVNTAIAMRRVEQHYAQLRPVLDYIETHISESLSLESLSKLIHLSPYHFSRLFKKTTSVTLTDYITSTRIRIAKKLLIEDKLTVTEIAESTGFHDVSYFGRVFKKEVGMTALQYKKMFQ